VAEQATDALEGTSTGAIRSTSAAGTVAHAAGHLEHNPGKAMSWVGVVIVIIGFLIGGIAMVPAPHWLIFWIGTGVAIIGCLTLLFTKTFSEDWY
jgi:MFS family permease